MSAFGKAKGGGRRKEARTGAPLLSTLSTVTDDYRVGLVNLSSTGARLSAPYLPKEGEEVIFRTDTVQSFGRVVWSHDGQCGVVFDGPILSGEVERLRREANMCSLMGMSPEERAAAEEWQLGIAP
jgi:PilZ domain-containing protein